MSDASDPTQLLAPLRGHLDDIDRQILALLARRMDVCLDIARTKARHGLPMMQPARVQLVVDRARAHAAAHGLDEDYLGDLYTRIVAETCTREAALMAAAALIAATGPDHGPGPGPGPAGDAVLDATAADATASCAGTAAGGPR